MDAETGSVGLRGRRHHLQSRQQTPLPFDVSDAVSGAARGDQRSTAWCSAPTVHLDFAAAPATEPISRQRRCQHSVNGVWATTSGRGGGNDTWLATDGNHSLHRRYGQRPFVGWFGRPFSSSTQRPSWQADATVDGGSEIDTRGWQRGTP
jgi:hypothetical protein